MSYWVLLPTYGEYEPRFGVCQAILRRFDASVPRGTGRDVVFWRKVEKKGHWGLLFGIIGCMIGHH